MVGLLITFLAIIIVFALIAWVLSLLPLPPPFGQIAYVVLVVVFVLILLGYLLPLIGGPVGTYHWR